MMLVIAVVQGSDADSVLQALNDSGFRATQVSSAGGYLRESNVTFLIGVDDESVAHVARLVESNTTAVRRYVNPLMPFAFLNSGADGDAEDGVRVGANIFVVRVDRFIRLTD